MQNFFSFLPRFSGSSSSQFALALFIILSILPGRLMARGGELTPESDPISDRNLENIAFHGSPDVSTDGVFRLFWESEVSRNYRVYEVSSESMLEGGSLVYQGSDLATTMTGKPDGFYYYRIEGEDGSRGSSTVQIQVRHHSLLEAFSYLTAGGMVFLFTVTLLVAGTIKESRSHG